MTRNDANLKIQGVFGISTIDGLNLLRALEALDLIKFDEPEQFLYFDNKRAPLNKIICALKEAGYKVEKV